MSHPKFLLLAAAVLGVAAGLVMRSLDGQTASHVAFAPVTAIVLLVAAASTSVEQLSVHPFAPAHSTPP